MPLRMRSRNYRKPRALPLILVVVMLTSCAIRGPDIAPNAHYSPARGSEDPVAIVPAWFSTDIDTELLIDDEAQGAVAGAGEVIAGCLVGGGITLLVPGVLLCLSYGIVVGGLTGALTVESEENVTAVHDSLDAQVTRLETHDTLALKVHGYLTRSGAIPSVVILERIMGPASAEDRPSYDPEQLEGYASLLELSVLEISFGGSGKRGTPICLQMSARAREVDGTTGKTLEELNYTNNIACHALGDWLDEDGARIVKALDKGYRFLAENIVDEFFFRYHPAEVTDPWASRSGRVVPQLALAPTYPPPGEQSLDSKLFRESKADLDPLVSGRFSVIDNVSPTFQWEAFPREFDLLTSGWSGFSDVSYELRVYDGNVYKRGWVIPNNLVYEATGILEPSYRLEGDLEPCKWYFWTVRARFRLNAVTKATVWAGAYQNFVGYHSPAYSRGSWLLPETLYPLFPFRTPASADEPTCWEEKLESERV